MRTLVLLGVVSVLAATTLAAEPRVRRNVPYAGPESGRRMLDVYAPEGGENHPVMVWLHGGAWKFGDKRGVQQKPKAFVERGFVFVSVNYRFVPDVTVEEIAEDVAQAIGWVRDNAKELGAAPDKLVVGGHSAGAHLAALVCTDPRYLKQAGLSLAAIRACVPVDTAMYDAPAQLDGLSRFKSRLYLDAFGEDEDRQRNLSPITHVRRGRNIPAFAVLHVARRADSTARSKAFVSALKKAGVAAVCIAGEDKTHRTINHDLGTTDDKPTQAMFEFLEERLRKSR